ncbi:MAG: hypothetical protein EXS03_02795 [Phycisphaerales bacterium]|nr:hypothetical protein [Phycisphaerales bacterium]
MTNRSPLDEHHELAALLGERAGLALSLLQGPSLEWAVRNRMGVLGEASSKAYLQRVLGDADELVRLASEFSVPETWLFRYPASFEFLRGEFESMRRGPQSRLVVASLGCATGVEAWCIAACALASGWNPDRVVVHAIDRNADALAGAAQGEILRGALREPLPPWSPPWITAEGGAPKVSSEVRSCVRFEAADLLVDGFGFSEPMDAVLCRNVLIYLDPALRSALRRRIVQWTRPDGAILLGHADGLNEGSLLVSVGPPSAFAWRPTSGTSPAAAASLLRKTPPRAAPSAHNRLSPAPGPTSQPQASVAAKPTRDASESLAREVRSLVAKRRLADAQQLTQSALREHPADTVLLELLAGVHAAQDHREEAHRSYQRLVYLEPRHGPALLALAELSLALGRTEEAENFRLRARRVMDQ